MNVRKSLKQLIVALFFLTGFALSAFADVYINVMAVNGSEIAKDTSVKYNLPGDLKSGDILDTSGLELDYNINDSNYYVHGKVALQPKESRTFRIRVRDIWKLSPQQFEDIKKEIEQGYEQIGKLKDSQQAELLKEELIKKLTLVQEQGSKAESIEKRIDAFRSNSKELQRIENSALAVDYWRSDPAEIKRQKIIRFNIEVENPFDVPKPYKNKHYLPAEVKPEDLIEFEGFEVRFDEEKKQAFLFKEEDLQAKEKKKYTIGIRDVWFVPAKDTDYLSKRANYAYDYLKNSKFASSSKILFDQVNDLLKKIEDSQAQKRDNIADHISAFRDNQRIYDSAKIAVESLEKLLSVYREDLDKSKVQNVMQKMQSLKGVADISKAVFNQSPTEGVTWKFIGWVLLFVGILTIASFLVWFIRSREKIISSESQTAADEKNKPSEQKSAAK